MLKQAWKKVGTALFWLTWPVWRLYMSIGTRTRVLVVCGDHVLVVKNWLGVDRWSLPGGGLHRGEEAAMGAARELKEETGIDLPHSKLQTLFEDTYKQAGISYAYQCFCTELQTAPALRSRLLEPLEAAWLHKSQLSPANAGPDVCQAIARWLKG